MPSRKGPPPSTSSFYAAQSRRAQRQGGLAALRRRNTSDSDELGNNSNSDPYQDSDVDESDASGATDYVDEDDEAEDDDARPGIAQRYPQSNRVPVLPNPPPRPYSLVLSENSLTEDDSLSTSSQCESSSSSSASVSSVSSEELDAERYAWQNMLSNVLEGDVLKSEKTRLSSTLAHQLDDNAGQRKYQANQVWWGLHAYLRQRPVEAEQRFTAEARGHIPKIFQEILNFKVTQVEEESAWHAAAVQQVQVILGKLSWAFSLYPSIGLMQVSQPVYNEPGLQERIEALQAWSTITTRLHVHLGILQKWTGTEGLEILKPGLEKIDEHTDTPRVEESFTEPVMATNGDQAAHSKHTKPKILDTSNFVERMMKESTIDALFIKRAIVDIYPLVRAAKDTFLTNRREFSDMGLPSFSDDLSPLVSFPMLLVQEALNLRLETASHVNKEDPALVLVDQLTEDFRDGLVRATQIKKEYLEIMEKDAEGFWKVPPIDLDAFNKVIVDAIKVFFRLLHWKLKSGNKAIYLKETEVVENEFDFLARATEQIDGGDLLIAEHFSMLTHRLILRVVTYFNDSLEVLQTRGLRHHETSRWFHQTLDNVRQRHRKLLRFGKSLAGRFQNAAEYSLETASTTININLFINALCDTDHFLIYNTTTMEEGIYIVANSELQDRPDLVKSMLSKAFTRSTQSDFIPEEGEEYEDDLKAPRYLLFITPQDPFLWTGRIMELAVPDTNIDLRAKRVRVVANGPDIRLAFARKQFLATFPIFSTMIASESLAHLARVNRDIKKIKLANFRLCESIIKTSERVREVTRNMEDSEALLANYFSFGADVGLRSLRGFERKFRLRLITELQKFAVKWVFFLCEDCDPFDSRTFKWVISALEYVRMVTKGDNIFKLSLEDFAALRSGVASCMALLISHFDILGARSNQEAHKDKDKLNVQSKEMRDFIVRQLDMIKTGSPDKIDKLLDDFTFFTLPQNSGEEPESMQARWLAALQLMDEEKYENSLKMGMAGRALAEGRQEDPSLIELASSKANISLKWQQGKFIGSGTYGTVYSAVNLESGTIMAVKEIRFQDTASASTLIQQIRDEMTVMAMLQHPHIVEYFGIEVHRDKVYIFEEYCQLGSLAQLLTQGPLADEYMVAFYAWQLLQGLIYLHSQGVVHRDIKPDNILIDGEGALKLADFGSAKVLARKSKTLAAKTKIIQTDFAAGLQNSLTGTPMYMSPEVIKGEYHDNQAAADIWSLGCVVLECITGKRPWAGLDNEWAIMFHIGVAKEHPPLPDPSELSQAGINFLELCLTIDVNKRPTGIELDNHIWLEPVKREIDRAQYGDAYGDSFGESDDTSSNSTVDISSQDGSEMRMFDDRPPLLNAHLNDIGEEEEAD